MDGRHYNALIPKGSGPFPVVIFFHGSNQTGDKSVRRAPLVAPILERGYAFVAPTALDISYSGGRRGTGWVNSGRRGDRDDHRFVRRVLADMEERFPIDPTRILVTGHSNGAFFSWYLACENVDPKLKAFAPVNGTLVRDRLGPCDGARARFNLLHTHGALDKTVPLEGTHPADGSWSTLGAEEAFVVILDSQNCREVEDAQVPPFEIRKWTRCNSRYAYEMAVFEGGHVVPRAWPDLALDWFEGLELR